jgi:hypothetical protein
MQRISRVFMFALACAYFTALVHADEKKISRSQVPAVVQNAAKQQSKGATIRGYSQDTEGGQLEYEVEMTLDGHSKDVSFGPDGRLLEIEEQVETSALPSNVQSGLKAKAGQGKITKIESITKHGTIVAYEAQVRTMGRHSEIQVGPDGKPLDHEE